jgi:hypothetical protein
MSHLSPEELLDLAEEAGGAGRDAVAHVATCETCRREIDSLRATLHVAIEAGRDVPEPSPFFWEALSAHVRGDVARQAGRSAAHAWPWGRWGWLVSGSAAAAAVLLVALWSGTGSRRATTITMEQTAVNGSDASAASTLTPIEDDPSLSLLGDLTAELDWDSVVAAGLKPEEGAVERVVAALDAVERAALQRLLQEASEGGQGGREGLSEPSSPPGV